MAMTMVLVVLMIWENIYDGDGADKQLRQEYQTVGFNAHSYSDYILSNRWTPFLYLWRYDVYLTTVLLLAICAPQPELQLEKTSQHWKPKELIMVTMDME